MQVQYRDSRAGPARPCGTTAREASCEPITLISSRIGRVCSEIEVAEVLFCGIGGLLGVFFHHFI